MISLVWFGLAAAGITQIIVYGKIFNRIRPTEGWFGDLFACTMCTGFWVGIFLWLISPLTELFIFDESLVTGLVCGGVSSVVSYILSALFGDDGIRISN